MDRFSMLLWFLAHPSTYPYSVRLLFRKIAIIFFGENDEREQAIDWCSRCCVDTNTALRFITGKYPNKPLETLFPSYFRRGEELVKKCPIKMGGPGNLDFLFWCAEYLKASKVIETGVAYGWSSLAILSSLEKRSGSKLISTDMPYPYKKSKVFVGCVVPDNLKHNWEIMRGADKRMLPKAIKSIGMIDMCHYDSDKSYRGRMRSYPKLWNVIRPGGIFISDDIGDNTAFRDFSRMVHTIPIVVNNDGKYLGVLIKPPVA